MGTALVHQVQRNGQVINRLDAIWKVKDPLKRSSASSGNHEGPYSHLFEHQDTVSRTDELRKLRDASLVQVRPGEAAVVEVDLGAAVLPVALTCGVDTKLFF